MFDLRNPFARFFSRDKGSSAEEEAINRRTAVGSPCLPPLSKFNKKMKVNSSPSCSTRSSGASQGSDEVGC